MAAKSLEHNRYITVALNDSGLHDINYGISSSDNTVTFPLGSDEFYRLYESGVLWNLNDRYGLMLDDYESGRISSEFEFLKSESEKLAADCPTVGSAIALACQLGTMICFDL